MYQPGQVFNVQYPFVRTTWERLDGDDESGFTTTEMPGWKPGVRYTQVGPEGDTRTHMDAFGVMMLTVVSVHKPGKYPTRVFYTRTWINPEGVAFGKGKLRVTSQSAFTGYTRGYRHWGEIDYVGEKLIDRYATGEEIAEMASVQHG